MGGNYGKKISFSIFGESHGTAIGGVLSGLPAGLALDMEFIEKQMDRRRPGQNNLTTQRNEADKVKILSGVLNGTLTGSPVSFMIENTSMHSKDYDNFNEIPRPGHADYPGSVKYNGFNDYRGGGHFSGRITAPLVFAGSVAGLYLREKGIYTYSRIKSLGDICDESQFDFSEGEADRVLNLDFPALSESKRREMKEKIYVAKSYGDSVGGVIECVVAGMPVGIGNPFFDSIESEISKLVFSVPAVKGIEFGAGFDITKLPGSEANDSYYFEDGKVKTKTNNNGGVLGGISNGMPIVFRVAVKPTASIYIEQDSVNLKTKEPVKLQIRGRHDPCIVQRALPVIESCANLALLELMI